MQCQTTHTSKPAKGSMPKCYSNKYFTHSSFFCISFENERGDKNKRTTFSVYWLNPFWYFFMQMWRIYNLFSCWWIYSKIWLIKKQEKSLMVQQTAIKDWSVFYFIIFFFLWGLSLPGSYTQPKSLASLECWWFVRRSS